MKDSIIEGIHERFKNGYYNNLPPYSYERDLAAANYLLGYSSKIDYNIEKARYEWINSFPECTRLPVFLVKAFT